MHNLSFTVHLFREGDTYVAHVPELDISSWRRNAGKGARQYTRANIKDAVRGFLEAAEDNKGILDEILEEAGYQRIGAEWKGPEFVGIDRVTMNL